jgi:hypothetical protein
MRAFIRGLFITCKKPTSILLGLGAFYSFWLYKAALTSTFIALVLDSREL